MIKHQYQWFCKTQFHGRSQDLLGKVQIVDVAPDKQVANIFGQLDFGRNPHKKYTDYTALTNAFHTIRNKNSYFEPSTMIESNSSLCLLRSSYNLASSTDALFSTSPAHSNKTSITLTDGVIDNNQRTVANVRSYFTKHGGSLGTQGSLSFLFDHKSVFHIKPADPSAVEEFELELMDFDAELDADPEAEEWVIYGAFDQFNNIQKYLEDKGIEIVSSEFERIPTDYKEVTPEQRENIEKLLERFEDDEDVQNVFHNMKDED